MVEKACAKFCRSVTGLPNPQAAAIRAMLQSVVSNSLRVSSSRRASSQRTGLVPVVSRKRRVKWRGDRKSVV